MNGFMTKINKKIIQLTFFLLILILLLTMPSLTLDYARKGLSIWYTSMVPSLFPMMIITGCMIKLNITSSFASFLRPITKKCYHLSKNGTYALLMGFLCGFPMGAKVICELYSQNKLSKEEANALLPVCNNIGPIFMLTYGLKSFIKTDLYLTLILFYTIPLVYSFFMFRNKTFPDNALYPVKKYSFSVALDEAIAEGAAGMLSLGGYLMFFSILLILPTKLCSVNPQIVSIVSCILEITNGLSYPSVLPPYIYLALLQFGGLCCIFQTLKYISNTDLSFKNYILHKIKLTFITFIFFFAYYVFVSGAYDG